MDICGGVRGCCEGIEGQTEEQMLAENKVLEKVTLE